MNKKHGCFGTRLYQIWASMKNRCQSKKSVGYPSYGGRGITVCEEWQNFENFQKWAHLSGYNESLTIDRIDNNKGYSPANCRWATYKEQARNRRNSHVVNGKCISQWAEDLGIHEDTIRWRLKNNWPIEKALTKKGE